MTFLVPLFIVYVRCQLFEMLFQRLVIIANRTYRLKKLKQKIESSRLLYKHVEIEMNTTIYNLSVCMGVKTLCLTLREEHGLRVLENAVPRCMFGPRIGEEEEPRES